LPDASPSTEPQNSTHISAPRKGIKRGKKLIISESEVRRSERLLSLNKGFKPSTCTERNYLGCATKPPLISSSVVRDLGASFCSVDHDNLSDEKLLAKPTDKGVVGRPKAKKAKGAENIEDEVGPSARTAVQKPKSKKAKTAKSKKDDAGPSKEPEKKQ
jgi:hypothetical protein